MAHKPVFTWEGGNVILFCSKVSGRSHRRIPLAGKGKLIIFPGPAAAHASEPTYATAVRTRKVKSRSAR